MVTYLIPLVALAWGWMDQERVTPMQLIAFTGIVAMVGLVQMGPRRYRYRHRLERNRGRS